ISFTVHRCFFFSSRRRHTRWPRDWSSDVCSSDLFARIAPSRIVGGGGDLGEWGGSYVLATAAYNAGRGNARKWLADFGDPRNPRSEERRVGKACRWRWWRELEIG